MAGLLALFHNWQGEVHSWYELAEFGHVTLMTWNKGSTHKYRSIPVLQRKPALKCILPSPQKPALHRTDKHLEFSWVLLLHNGSASRSGSNHSRGKGGVIRMFE